MNSGKIFILDNFTPTGNGDAVEWKVRTHRTLSGAKRKVWTVQGQRAAFATAKEPRRLGQDPGTGKVDDMDPTEQLFRTVPTFRPLKASFLVTWSGLLFHLFRTFLRIKAIISAHGASLQKGWPNDDKNPSFFLAFWGRLESSKEIFSYQTRPKIIRSVLKKASKISRTCLISPNLIS